MHIAQSEKVHANQADEVFYRIGDKSKKLNFEQRMQLVYAKGEHFYEDAPVLNAKPEDIDMSLVGSYCDVIGYRKALRSIYGRMAISSNKRTLKEICAMSSAARQS